MEEYLDILTPSGTLTGKTALKSSVHSNGYYHNTAHLWLYTPNREILLAQRSATKVICPLLWDVSVAGHVDAGETITEAVIREAQEEIGLILSTDQLKKIGVFSSFQTYEKGLIDNEFHHTFIAPLNQPLNTLIPEPNEVEGLKLVTLINFEELLNASGTNSHFVPSNFAYYKLVLESITDTIKNH